MSNAKYEVDLIEESGLFDKSWYLSEYPDVTAAGIDPLEHYLRYGARLRRKPNLTFDTDYYLDANPDVARAGVNPLVHYILHGIKEGRSGSPFTVKKKECGARIDIIVPVFNALEDVKSCLKSIRERQDGFVVRIIVVNDGSDTETMDWLRSFCHADDIFDLIEHEENRGYTKAVNSGLAASNAPYVIILNSDTIVTRGWLKGLVRCVSSDLRIGIVGPLSNAASWQNVPNLYDSTRNFAVNELPNGITPDEMAQIVAAASTRTYPRLPFVNGFCFMIKREVIDAIGTMDEDNFPVGYGEENDYCIRAGDAGFKLAVADDTYVFHAKSKSFGHDRRKELSRQGSDMLKRKHTASKFAALVERVKQTERLDEIRAKVQKKIRESGTPVALINTLSIKILFLLPVKGGGGGSHSVVQEVSEMQRLGMFAKIAVKSDDLPRFLQMYDDISEADQVFVGFTPENLLTIIEDYDVVVGTIFSSMVLVKQIVEVNPHILPAYYVQDYEPLFFPHDSENWHAARESYTLVPNAVLFAKTHWIANKIKQEHGVTVHKVSPSIDHEVYRPAPKSRIGKLLIVAMIRPQTPVRGADRTMHVLSKIAQVRRMDIEFHLFGCPEHDPRFQNLTRNFDYQNHGVLKRREVAQLLAKSDIFIDLSDYQAFGRTALEAMACGCAAMVPVHGGCDEYAVDGVNSLLVDSSNEDECVARLHGLLTNRKQLHRMQSAGLLTASTFSVHNAAVTEINLFEKFLPGHREHFPIQEKRKLVLMPSRRKDGMPAGSGYVRLLLPYGSSAVRQYWKLSECAPNKLPEPGVADVVIIQREAGDFPLKKIKPWLESWRAANGRMLYEIDDDLLNAEGLKQRNFKGDAAQLSEKVCWLCEQADAVTVSTSTLQEKFRKLNRNIYLVPNFLDANLWRLHKSPVSGPGIFMRREGDPIRIGYIGTPTHDPDLNVVAEAMRKIESEFVDRVEIEVIGAFQNKTPSFGKRVGLSKRNDYPNFVNWLHHRIHWDIGIIPLVDDSFNKSKSHLKFLEYAALGLAIICSDVESYRSIAQDGINCLVVKNTTEAWRNAVKRLIQDRDLRMQLSVSAVKVVKSAHTTDHAIDQYLNVLAKSIEPTTLRNPIAA